MPALCFLLEGMGSSCSRSHSVNEANSEENFKVLRNLHSTLACSHFFFSYWLLLLIVSIRRLQKLIVGFCKKQRLSNIFIDSCFLVFIFPFYFGKEVFLDECKRNCFCSNFIEAFIDGQSIFFKVLANQGNRQFLSRWACFVNCMGTLYNDLSGNECCMTWFINC